VDKPSAYKVSVLEAALERLHMEDTHVAQIARDIWNDKGKRWGTPTTTAIATACCIYEACLGSGCERVPRASKEICVVLGVDAKRFSKAWNRWCEDPEMDVGGTKARDCVIRQLQQIPQIELKDVHEIANAIAVLDERRKAKKLMVASPPMIVNAVLACVFIIRRGASKAEVVAMKKNIVDLGWASMTSMTKYIKLVIAAGV
jgi:transcription initiation factor TFIIIB Brf1 subunit/transcription initiation factor TFIIB